MLATTNRLAAIDPAIRRPGRPRLIFTADEGAAWPPTFFDIGEDADAHVRDVRALPSTSGAVIT